MKQNSPRRLTARVLVSAPLAIGVFLAAAGCGGGSSGGGGGGSGAPGTVSSVSPAAGGKSVATNTKLNASFSAPMDPATITPTTFTVTGPNGTPVPGSISYIDLTNVATFAPSSALAANTTFTATLTTGIRDLGGNPLPTNFVWTFKTTDGPDTTRPIVTFKAPDQGQTNVAPNGNVTATFSESMDPASISATSFTLSHGASDAGTVTYTDSGRVATFNPTQDLLVNTLYTATVKAGVKDLAGNTLASDHVWTFTTGSTLDTTPPTVTSTNPADVATNVATNKKVNATFSEQMDPTTLTTLTYTLTGPGPAQVAGTVGYDGPSKIATFTPTSNLAGSTSYTARITAGAKDLAGNALASDRVWTFTTGTLNTLLPVELGRVGPFAVFAYTTVTNDGPTAITGDLGLSPGSAVTGFPPGTVNGTMHLTNTTAANAKLDLQVAYDDAQGRSTNPIALPEDLANLVLTPGLYKNSTFVNITTGNLTLDAQGDTTAVWIFQTAGNLIMSSGTQVVLAGGAKASNVFWALGDSATINTTAAAKGTILAFKAISVKTGASLDGRALALNAAVTLETNAVTLPSP